ncbi:MAG: hypothetical protein PHG66_00845 [Candidatus Colwellbacteria bacterium]|nr:hypothetical protein [Candidatus Colwellbacteria bacterium]
MSRLNWRSNPPKKQIDEQCAVRIIPYVIEKDGTISLFLGLDKRFKEWTPAGGACNEQKGSCSRRDTSSLKTCLARELSEESKEIIDLDQTVDFVNCRFIHYVVKLSWANMHNNIYFAQWTGDNKESIISYFNDAERDKSLRERLQSEGKTPKIVNSYFEMDSIDFIPVTYEVFGEYIYNSIQDFYKLEETYKKDKAFYAQISDTFSAMFKHYPKKDNGNTNGRRLDPRFLLGMVEAISDYLSNEFKYKHVDDIVDDIIRYIKGIKNGCSLNSDSIRLPSKSDSSKKVSEDDTPLV